ncbi:MAG: rRNA maturation RNase YbeY [Pseudomonadota bacterium]
MQDRKLTVVVDISADTEDSEPPSSEAIHQWIALTLSKYESLAEALFPASEIRVSVNFATLQEITELNHQFRDKNYPTNVLAFPDSIFLPDTNELQLGDIAICGDIVRQEALVQNKPPIAHWAHMVIHATLHLLGYNHIIHDEAVQMENVEIALLAELGYLNPYHLTSELIPNYFAPLPYENAEG